LAAEAFGPGHRISEYEISDHHMAVGSTLGSPKAALIIKATGAIEKFYSIEDGSEVFNTLVLHHWDPRNGIPLTPNEGKFDIHPAYQTHTFELSNSVVVHEKIFVLSGAPGGPDLHEVDPPAAYYTVTLRNEGPESVEIDTYASLRLVGSFDGGTDAAYDERRRTFVVSSRRNADLVRVAACTKRPASYEVTLDSAKASAPDFPGALSNRTMETTEDPIAIFHLHHRLAHYESAEFAFVLTFSTGGEETAMRRFDALPDPQKALQRTLDYYREVLGRAVVMTPDPWVNRGALWAKANMLRVQLFTGQGWCFVNDPTRSNNSVGRDTAWFGFGSDYVTPQFSKESVRWYLDHLDPSGMVVEYFDVRNGTSADYGLNVNDDTPLIIIAAWHHYTVTGDRDFLEAVYPKALQASRYLLSQRNEDGLVWCTARAKGERGIVGWRNVMEDWGLSGATTELNAECFGALRRTSTMASVLGRTDEAREFAAHAEDLRNAINTHLLDKDRKLYYLNIDPDGTPQTAVSCDLVFPVLFGVADGDVAANIIARLSVPEFWSEAGLHTAARTHINYGPTHEFGLLGGIWGGPTYWFANAASRHNPEFMVYALSTAFRHYAEDPKRNNTVPGQFCEWLHGETLANQGMMLSPWFPPKYLWTAIEGAAGLELDGEELDIHPRPASDWAWLAVHNVTLRGKPASWFFVRIGDEGQLYASYPFPSVDAERRYDDDVSTRVHVTGDDAVCIALRRAERTVIMVGNTRDRTISTALSLDDGISRKRCRLRFYNSLRGEWVEDDDFDAKAIGDGIPVQVNRHGFCVLEFTYDER
jgi:glycogen debranching enzyme